MVATIVIQELYAWIREQKVTINFTKTNAVEPAGRRIVVAWQF